MDDIRRVTELLDEGGPSPTVAATGRQRLDELIGQEPRTDQPKPRVEREPQRRRIRWALPGFGLVAAGAAAAIALTVTASPSGAPRPGSSHSETSRWSSGREVLLAAAYKAEAAPPTSGKYWHVRYLDIIKVQGRSVPGGGKSVQEFWYGMDGAFVSGGRSLTTGKGGLHKEKFPRATFELTDQKITLTELSKLPTDPQKLKEWALADSRRHGAPKERPADTNSFATNDLTELLYLAPVSPKVRAAAFRALALMPDVKGLGALKDARGRVGQGIAISGERYIIDPDTGFLLSWDTRVDRKSRSNVFLAVGWTNERPHVPAAP
ncbi:CU044_5270 family protein [Actinoallomurus purpureus]|uniref:CU044_5270 family protein n=1 Tax=Actinoallomurus purpureus TaxID=478114 RepID=UPI0020937FF6|nr:CU044_5270 family protein [Actinoallomurus purpureus]MCO6011164.1 CU044_5270 family protein [Actinoallomurus purpureus]